MEVYVDSKFVKEEENSSYKDEKRIECMNYFLKDKCSLSVIKSMCLDLGIDYRSSKLFWRVPSVRDDISLPEVASDEDANMIEVIVLVISTRLVKVFVIYKKKIKMTVKMNIFTQEEIEDEGIQYKDSEFNEYDIRVYFNDIT